MNAPQSASLYLAFARSQLRVCTASAAGLLTVHSQHLWRQRWTRAMMCLYIFSTLSPLTGQPSRLKGIKHLAPHQSFIVRHGSDHTWAKGGLKTSWAEDTRVSTAAPRSYHALSKHKPCVCWCCSPDSYCITPSVFSKITIVLRVITGHLQL